MHGHSRTWNQCYKNFFKNVHSQLPGDIFIHTWDTVNASQASYWGPYGYQNALPDQFLEIANQTPDLKGIFEAYKPKLLMVEPDKKPDFSVLAGVTHEYNDSTPSHVGTKNMLYQAKVIMDVAKAYDDYDYFFSTRMDIDYPELLAMEEIAEMLEHNVISASWIRSNEISDIWMFGPKDLMEIKANYFYHIDDLWFKREPDLTNFGYEKGLHRYLIETCNVPIRSANLPCTMVRLF